MSVKIVRNRPTLRGRIGTFVKCSDREKWRVLLNLTETLRHSQSELNGFPNLSNWSNRSTSVRLLEVSETIRVDESECVGLAVI